MMTTELTVSPIRRRIPTSDADVFQFAVRISEENAEKSNSRSSSEQLDADADAGLWEMKLEYPLLCASRANPEDAEELQLNSNRSSANGSDSQFNTRGGELPLSWGGSQDEEEENPDVEDPAVSCELDLDSQTLSEEEDLAIARRNKMLMDLLCDQDADDGEGDHDQSRFSSSSAADKSTISNITDGNDYCVEDEEEEESMFTHIAYGHDMEQLQIRENERRAQHDAWVARHQAEAAFDEEGRIHSLKALMNCAHRLNVRRWEAKSVAGSPILEKGVDVTLRHVDQRWQTIAEGALEDIDQYENGAGAQIVQRKLSCMGIFSHSAMLVVEYSENEAERCRRVDAQKRVLQQLALQEACGTGDGKFLRQPNTAATNVPLNARRQYAQSMLAVISSHE